MTFTNVNESKEAYDWECSALSCNIGFDVYVPSKNHVCPIICTEGTVRPSVRTTSLTLHAYDTLTIPQADQGIDFQMVFCHPTYSIFLTYTWLP